jgi:hypothetical protein
MATTATSAHVVVGAERWMRHVDMAVSVVVQVAGRVLTSTASAYMSRRWSTENVELSVLERSACKHPRADTQQHRNFWQHRLQTSRAAHPTWAVVAVVSTAGDQDGARRRMKAICDAGSLF